MVRVVSFRKLREFYEAGHADAEAPLKDWFDLASDAEWKTFADVRKDYPGADLVGDRLVFNVGGNKYRLVVLVDFQRHGLLVRFIGAHAEYDKIDVRTI